MKDYSLENLKESDKWIVTKLNLLIQNVREHMDKYEFNVVGSEIYSFIWDDFCDWYIELAKINMDNTTKSVLIYTLENILKLLHPFMPYVTEEIYQMLPNALESIMISSYPVYDETKVFNSRLDDIIALISRIRKIKLENNIGKEFFIEYDNAYLSDHIDLVNRLTKINQGSLNKKSCSKIEIAFQDGVVTLYYDGSENLSKLKESLEKEKERLENSIQRRQKLLSNENYVNKAPADLVSKEKETLEHELQELELIKNKLS